MSKEFKVVSCEAHTFKVWIAGDYEDAKRACKEFTLTGLCVSLQPSDFVYTMGSEKGVCVTLINYPRFPKSQRVLEGIAVELGLFLCDKLFQGSFTVEGPKGMAWFSRRGEADDEK